VFRFSKFDVSEHAALPNSFRFNTVKMMILLGKTDVIDPYIGLEFRISLLGRMTAVANTFSQIACPDQ
jgi:hypothetical protein